MFTAFLLLSIVYFSTCISGSKAQGINPSGINQDMFFSPMDDNKTEIGKITKVILMFQCDSIAHPVTVVLLCILFLFGLILFFFHVVRNDARNENIATVNNLGYLPFTPYQYTQSSNDWEIPRKSLTFVKKLGEGEFGMVAQAQLLHGLLPRHVAVKMVKESCLSEDTVNLYMEIQTLKNIGQHENIITFYGCCTKERPLYVILQLAEKGNLRDFLRMDCCPPNYIESLSNSKKRMPLTSYDKLYFAIQIARGMQYLESKEYIHRDLAARNVLVTNEICLKISDFGLARPIVNSDGNYKKCSSGRLPVKWMAPESLTDSIYSTRSDVWSFGILLWEIVTFGSEPYPDLKDLASLIHFLKQGNRMLQPPDTPYQLYHVMRQCWHYNSESRPSFMELKFMLESYYP